MRRSVVYVHCNCNENAVIEFSRNAGRNGVPQPVSGVPPPEIAVPPLKLSLHNLALGQLIFGKIIKKIGATNGQILRHKCTKFFRLGSGKEGNGGEGREGKGKAREEGKGGDKM